MKAMGLIAAALFLAISTTAFGQGLDRPISNKPTIRSEIARGNDAGFECQLHNIGRFRLIDSCVASAVSQNTQQQKANDAFKLGIYSTVLFHWESVGPNQTQPQDNPESLVASGINLWRSEVKRARAALKLTDKDICVAMELEKCDALYASLRRVK